MPRVKIVKMEDGSFQVAVKPNSQAEGITRMAKAVTKEGAKQALARLVQESVDARPVFYPGQKPSEAV